MRKKAHRFHSAFCILRSAFDRWWHKSERLNVNPQAVGGHPLRDAAAALPRQRDHSSAVALTPKTTRDRVGRALETKEDNTRHRDGEGIAKVASPKRHKHALWQCGGNCQKAHLL